MEADCKQQCIYYCYNQYKSILLLYSLLNGEVGLGLRSLIGNFWVRSSIPGDVLLKNVE